MNVTFANPNWDYADLEISIGDHLGAENNPISAIRLNKNQVSGNYVAAQFLYWRKKANIDQVWSPWTDVAIGYDDKQINI